MGAVLLVTKLSCFEDKIGRCIIVNLFFGSCKEHIVKVGFKLIDAYNQRQVLQWTVDTIYSACFSVGLKSNLHAHYDIWRNAYGGE